MLLVQQTKAPIKLLASQMHRKDVTSQAVAGGPQDVRARENLSAEHLLCMTVREFTLMSPSIFVSPFALSFTFRYDIFSASASVSLDCIRDFSIKLKEHALAE